MILVLFEFCFVLIDHFLCVSEVTLNNTIFLIEIDRFFLVTFQFYLLFKVFNTLDESFVSASESSDDFLELDDFEVEGVGLRRTFVVEDIVYFLESFIGERILLV